MGYHRRLTGQEIRATISTGFNKPRYPKEWIKAQLSRSNKVQVRAYDHAQYEKQRRRLMQECADRLDEWETKNNA